MRIQVFHRLISAFLVAAMVSAASLGGGAVYAAGGQNNARQQDVQSAYEITAAESGNQRFYHKQDGYSIEIPAGMTLTNILPGVQTVFESQDIRLEVYKENYTTQKGMSILINYGNKFKETADHVVDYESSFHFAGYEGYIFQYHRNKLARVENDKNYYTEAMVLVPGKGVYSFRFKSSYILDYGKVYIDIMNSFRSEEITAGSFAFTFEDRTAGRGWNAETQAVFNMYFAENSALTWGIFEPAAPVWFEKLGAIESLTQNKFPILLFYNNIMEDQSTNEIRTALKRGKQNGDRLVELTIQTKAQENGSNMVYSILNGQYDQYLKNLADDIRDADTPVLFRLCNEMNGDWCVYSAYHLAKDAEVFVEFYKYVYDFMVREGVNDKLIWVWNPNEKSFPNFKWNHELLYYPGSDYVDVVGLTGYNTGTYYHGESWRDFDTIYRDIYNNAIAWYGKPLMITEFASSSVGGDKAAWINDMFQSIRSYPKIKVAVWWSGADYDVDMTPARIYWMDESPEILEVFRRNLNK